MIQASTLQFLKDIKKNNRKEWFDVHRRRFEQARDDFENFTGEVIRRISEFDESIAHLRARECTFRQNRDVRFSKDKSPYKVNMGMYISKGGKKGVYPGYYFHLEPGKSLLAGGLWMPMAPELKKVRQEIDYNWEEFSALMKNKNLVKKFGSLERTKETALSRPPKGYETDNAAIEYLKLKSFIATKKVADAELHSKNLAKVVAADFQVLKPLLDFIHRALED